jgi:hypothetical protein
MAKKYPKPVKWNPIHPEKYAGDPSTIILRSSWERRFCKWVDSNPNVISWSSESFCIPYISPLDGKMHRYFPDNLMTIKTKEGVKTYLVEIKPHSQANPSNSRRRKTFIRETEVYAVNMSKWEAADKWCKVRGYEFIVLTEYELGIK